MSVRWINRRPKAVIVIETDQDNYLATSSGRKAFYSAFTTFNLAVMGSSVLPMPYALSHTGAAVGLLTMLLVALCNDYTSMLMVSAAYETGLDSFESLAHWAGGPTWKLFTQVTLIALLWGPNSGALSMMGDVAQVICDKAFGNPPTLGYLLGSSSIAGSSMSIHATTVRLPPPAAVAAGFNSVARFANTTAELAAAAATATAGSSSSSSSGLDWLLAAASNARLDWLLNGQSLMVLLTIVAVFPLSCQKHMRSLEGAAGAGLVIVAGLCALLGYKAVTLGWPAVESGDFALWSFKLTSDLPEVFSLLGFAFYLQPLMMPIIREMPEGRKGRNALTAAVHASLLGSSLLLYAGTGFFGAALFGKSTDGNVMVNAITDTNWGFSVVYGCMLLYLAAGAAASQYPLRTSVDMLLFGDRLPMTTARAMVINGVTLSVSLLIAIFTPGGAEKVYAVVGASGVCIVCYILPVWFHLKLMYVRSKKVKLRTSRELRASGDIEQYAAPLISPSPHSSASSLTAPVLAAAAAAALGSASTHSSRWWVPHWLRSAAAVVMPVFVMCLGIGFSVAALYVAVTDIMRSR